MTELPNKAYFKQKMQWLVVDAGHISSSNDPIFKIEIMNDYALKSPIELFRPINMTHI